MLPPQCQGGGHREIFKYRAITTRTSISLLTRTRRSPEGWADAEALAQVTEASPVGLEQSQDRREGCVPRGKPTGDQLLTSQALLGSPAPECGLPEKHLEVL